MKIFGRRIIAILVFISICALLAACGNSVNSQAAPTKSSNKVVIYMPSPASLDDKLAADFTKKTGIKVEQFQGTTGQILARLEAEKGNPQADVIMLASWSDGLSLKKQNILLAYQPKNADKLTAKWQDNNHMIYGISASAVGVIYNTSIFPKLDADWNELATNPIYKNQMIIPDPKKSGSCKDFIDGWITAKGDNGWKILHEMAAQGMHIRGANKAALSSVLTGEKGILIAGVDYNAFSYIKKGEPIAIYYPKGGTVVNPRPAMILKAAPDQENAKKFMDYLLSKDAQKLIAAAYLLPGRNDIIQNNRIPLSSITQIKTNWEQMTQQSTKIMKKFTALMHPGQ
ncbi:ABC transporter substrate-binding protein [Pectinatus sottacetonis]|uniref:ABC transporter substrate-binding protein n=1 Tax=Pectinatus sottacetonis TaxID=1002795 RepID=UPI0018C7E2F6|nr:ABC transporter substrate-binding protein [Pectinatus sottacetonis]